MDARGDMSLVGPKPHPVQEVANYELLNRCRLYVIPGMTGLQQISGRSDLDFKHQVALDCQYIESQSLWLDIVISQDHSYRASWQGRLDSRKV